MLGLFFEHSFLNYTRFASVIVIDIVIGLIGVNGRYRCGRAGQARVTCPTWSSFFQVTPAPHIFLSITHSQKKVLEEPRKGDIASWDFREIGRTHFGLRSSRSRKRRARSLRQRNRHWPGNGKSHSENGHRPQLTESKSKRLREWGIGSQRAGKPGEQISVAANNFFLGGSNTFSAREPRTLPVAGGKSRGVVGAILSGQGGKCSEGGWEENREMCKRDGEEAAFAAHKQWYGSCNNLWPAPKALNKRPSVPSL